MTIPNHQFFMRPILEVLSDGETWHIHDVYEAVAEKCSITKEDKTILLSSGAEPLYKSRIR